MILVFLTGGLSHLDSFDMKPDAPEGIRGEFKPISTAVPGISMCEHLPGLAARAGPVGDRAFAGPWLHQPPERDPRALDRSLTAGRVFRQDCLTRRLSVLCRGGRHDPPAGRRRSERRDASHLSDGRAAHWPGQHAGFLGPKHDPWQVRQDPNRPGFGFEGLALPTGLSVERLDRRKSLLDQVGRQVDQITSSAIERKDPFAEQLERAYALLLSGKVARAFDLTREDPRLRDRYGRHMYGQSLLLARRLVTAGVPVVQVNMGRVQTWDTHSQNFKSLKNRLLPPLDRGVSALLDDLKVQGLLDETLVVVTGEFGARPRIGSSTGNANTRDGRDHWAAVFSAAFAGAGVRGGQTIGAIGSDRGLPGEPSL